MRACGKYTGGWLAAGFLRGDSRADLYRLPTAADVPAIKALIVEVPTGDGPYGAKVVGEPPMITPVAAIANAVADAAGVRVYDLPITPERV